MRELIVAGLVVMLPCLTLAQSSVRANVGIVATAKSAFQQGVDNQTRFLLARKHFSEATDAYLELHNGGVRSPSLYLNLGNAATLADRWPLAIWAYQVGLQLDPSNRDLRDHLGFVRNKVLYPASGLGGLDADVWPMWLPRPTLRELWGVAVFSYVLAWMGGTCAFLRRSPRLLALAAFAMVIAAASVIGLWSEVRQAEIDRATPLVIIAENTPLYRGNGMSYPLHPDLPTLPRGMEVRQLHRRGVWLQIRLSSGEIGWLPLDRALVVEP